MTVAEIMQKMLEYPPNTPHDIRHLMKVWGFARTIGQLEGLDDETQRVLEIAAIVHDIACPLCREKYGHADGKHQEQEGGPLAREFLRDAGLTSEQLDRVVYLVAHHHTLTGVDGIDYQILLEADYIVNADESGYSRANIENFAGKLCRTPSGGAMLRAIYDL